MRKRLIIGIATIITGLLITQNISANLNENYQKPSEIISQLTNSFWEDNFDSYDVGSSMHGQGGWKGWDNNPNAAGYVSDVQSNSSPHSVEIAWFGGTAADLIYEFTGVSSGEWTFTAYQYIPSNFSGNTNFLLLNSYTDGGPYHWSNAVSFSIDCS